MLKSSLPTAAFAVFLSVTLSSPAFAQGLCGGIYPPCGPTATSGSSGTGGTSASASASVSNAPGYTTPTGGYGRGKTVAYVIAPLGIVAGTYLLGHHQIEVHPNVGFFWPRQTTSTQLRNEGAYGVKAAAALNDSVQVEGNISYINHFESRIAPTKVDQLFGIPSRSVHGLLYDVNGVWNFRPSARLGNRMSPYVTAGVGGLSTEIRQDTTAILGGQFYASDRGPGTAVLDTGPKIIVADNSAFFSVNYGGGIKIPKVWGPMGFRADLRGRTFPNFRGNAMTWPEATAGLMFAFGER